MRFFVGLVIAIACGVSAIGLSGMAIAETPEPPKRVVSANLCADQLLLALADAEQIASLSPLARDPSLSYLASRATAFPANRGSGEDLIHVEADLVLLGPYDGRYTRALLQERGIRFKTLDPWTSFEQGFAQIRELSSLLGHSDRGKELISEISGELEKLRRRYAQRTTHPTALVLHRRGFVYHAGLTGEIAAAAGLRDAAPGMGIPTSGFVSMEQLIVAKPDFLIVSDADVRVEDQGQAFLVHPALAALWPKDHQVVAPDRLTMCGGPSTMELIRTLGAEIAAKAP